MKTIHPSFSVKALSLAIFSCFYINSALANPVGPQVVAGAATFTQQGNTLVVNNSTNAAINWQSFSIGSNEATRFIQPSASSSVLNRVTGGDPSSILGSLHSNGNVFLINPAGILVGAGARVDTAGFIASTLNLSTTDFLAGKLNFTTTPNAGKVQNFGTITTPQGGSVYLIGNGVENHGHITTPGGEIILAAGKTIQLIDTATPGVRVELVADDQKSVNLGQLVAESGRVGITGALVRQAGKVSASSAVAEGGRVFLKASRESTVDNNSTTEATGTQGGRVEVLGQQVSLTGQSTIDASGQQGGGVIVIGGDYQGKNPDVLNASQTVLSAESNLKADALERGDGGKIIVWGNDQARIAGNISAMGGKQSGNGGFVETSAAQIKIADLTKVSTAAPNGKAGLWLIDPNDYTIAATGGDITGATLGANLNTGAVTILSSSGGSGSNGAINVNDPVTWTSSNALTLTAVGAINLNSSLSGASGAVTMTAPGGINQAAGAIITTDKLKINAGANVVLSEANMVNSLAIDMGTSGNLTYTNGKSLTIDTVDSTNGVSFATNPGTIKIKTTVGNLTLSQPVSTGPMGGGDIELEAAGALALNASVDSVFNATPNGVVTLKAGTGGIAGSGVITASGLAINSLGAVNLSTSNHAVANLAANIGGGVSKNPNFAFKAAGTLSIRTVNGIQGISIYDGEAYSYNPALPKGIIKLEAAGDIGQTTTGLIAGRALFVKSTTGSVALTEANSTGVVAGEAAASNSFSYTSTNSIWLTDIGGSAGVSAPSGVTLTAGGGISADTSYSGAIISSAGTTLLNATSGDITLPNDNTVSNLGTSQATAGGILLKNTQSLNISGAVSAGSGKKVIIENGINPLTLTSTGTIDGPAGVSLRASSVDMSTSSGTVISSSAGTVRISTDQFTHGASAVIDSQGFAIAPQSSGKTIEINTGGCTNGTLCLESTDFTEGKITATTMQIGNSAPVPMQGFSSINTPAAGAIEIKQPINRGTNNLYLASDGNIAQDASGLITAGLLGVISSNGSVALNSTDNAVGTLIGRAPTSSFYLQNGASLTIGSGTPLDGSLVNGITANTGVNLKSTGAGITVNQAIVGGSSVTLDTYGGLSGSAASISDTVTLRAGMGGIGSSGTPFKTAAFTLASGSTLTVTASSGIYLQNNSSGNSATLNISEFSCPDGCSGGIRSTSGDVSITNYGAIVSPSLPGSFLPTSNSYTSNAAIQAGGTGNITLVANSPLTIGSSGIYSDGSSGNISLTAGSPDSLNVNGPISTTSGAISLSAPGGNITLTAALTTSGTISLSAPNGTVSGSSFAPGASITQSGGGGGGGGGTVVAPPTVATPPVVVTPPTVETPSTVIAPPTQPPPAETTPALPLPITTLALQTELQQNTIARPVLQTQSQIAVASQTTTALIDPNAVAVCPPPLVLEPPPLLPTLTIRPNQTFIGGTVGGESANSFGGNELARGTPTQPPNVIGGTSLQANRTDNQVPNGVLNGFAPPSALLNDRLTNAPTDSSPQGEANDSSSNDKSPQRKLPQCNA